MNDIHLKSAHSFAQTDLNVDGLYFTGVAALYNHVREEAIPVGSAMFVSNCSFKCLWIMWVDRCDVHVFSPIMLKTTTYKCSKTLHQTIIIIDSLSEFLVYL